MVLKRKNKKEKGRETQPELRKEIVKVHGYRVSKRRKANLYPTSGF